MIASSILNPITFKAIASTYPNAWNTLHADRRQSGAKVIEYYQPWNYNHVAYLQIESDIADAVVLKSINCTTRAEIETIALTSQVSRGISPNIRYFNNFVVTLDADYLNKKAYFTATQGSTVLTSEPILTTVLTEELASGLIKYIKYTNLDRIDSDLDDRFIDWTSLTSTGKYLDFFIEAVDLDPNDSDESEVLEGSQSKTILSAVYYTGKELKTGPIPDYVAARLGMASSLDIFTVNGLQYIKNGAVNQDRFGSSTLYQCSMKLTQKNAIGINVDSLGATTAPITPPISGTPMYIGAVTAAAPDETEVKTMTSSTASKTNQTKVYTTTDARFCFAYPTSFGSLSSILDNVGDEIISGFNVTTLDFTIGADTINFTIYTLKSLVTVTSHSVQYKF